ncbi:AhpD family alkylhydroperoxidase [Sinobaca qinghaiensis]|uniref:AhpD family alkylhydroperoxidase n=1 Tax=Sinobaca qinghaiensis TaxID=342944 RepID=A0A419V523_9BACL|nr:carboxymuconolactone decarboxylase family protein [Sinobaca qinghaiensis]RKD73522.1 AhpD family alkylhydroperoxidase [Sinobaca qinghaiensis]
MEEGILYKKEYFTRLEEFASLAPEAFRTFIAFDQQVMESGSLDLKLKELAAIAVAHTTGCPYCIELHVGNAKTAGASKEEMGEAILTAAALKAGSALAHGVNALNAYDEKEDDVLYKKEYFNRLSEFSKLVPTAFQSFAAFDAEAVKGGTLSVKEKELIAVATAHTTGCPYCIEVHTKAAKAAGASLEDTAEIIMVAAALKAGSALAHGVNALNAYDS